ncbi:MULTISPECIES: hypothetical protein [unclassified Dietzia]|uniref:hypothetical protein n=1 Tax=unclassified Dietzia TaxID=2617939 RepID=UPI0015FC4078|nr:MULTISPECIES: hypothetical protein [unclassified Dietzia]MBB1027522.1 hypothetical protein [Dietzia sp. DQ11-38-2]
MALLRPSDPPVAIHRNGHAIQRVMRNGVEVWSAGGDWAWVDDFTTVDPRWTEGTFTPPGVTNGYLIGPELPPDFVLELDVAWSDTMTSTAAALAISTPAGMIGTVVYGHGEAMVLYFGGIYTIEYVTLGPTSRLRLERSGDDLLFTVDGVLLATIDETAEIEGKIYLIAQDGGTITRLSAGGDWDWDPPRYVINQNPFPLQPAGSNAWTTHGSFVATRDMVVDLSTLVQWRGAYSSQRVAIRIGGWWVVYYPDGGVSTMQVQNRAFVPQGTEVIYETTNNTSAGVRWIDDGYYRAIESKYSPQSSGPVAPYRITQNVWARMSTRIMHESGTVTASVTGYSWAQATSASNRFIRVCRNGVEMARSVTDGSSVTATFTVNKYDEISFEARSESGTASFRDITTGIWSVVEA